MSYAATQYQLGIITPTYNEAGNIRDLIQQIYEQASALQIKTQYLIIDDNSQDSTRQIIEEMIEEINDPNFVITLHRRTGKMGLASAYVTGIKMLKNSCDVIVTMDGDLSHSPRYLAEMLPAMSKGSDLVIGSRYVAGGGISGWSTWRLLLSRLGSLYAQIILTTPIKDFTGGYNMYRSAIFDTLDLSTIQAEGYMFQIEMKYRISKLGFQIIEIPIIFTDRIAGESKISKKIIFEAFFGVIKLRLGI